jgi:hypothetical protein
MSLFIWNYDSRAPFWLAHLNLINKNVTLVIEEQYKEEEKLLDFQQPADLVEPWNHTHFYQSGTLFY